MNENLRVKGFRDAGDLYNHLSYKGILKGSNRDSILGEEGYTSEFYNKWKEDSVYGQMLQGEITLRLLGEYRVHQDSVVLLKVMREDGLQGIVDIQLNTIIPLKYCAIKMIELRDNVMFISDKIDGEQVLHSLYTLDGCVIENALEITPAFAEKIEYDTEEKDGFVGDMVFSMQKKKICNQVLLKKRYSVFENKIIRNLVENADPECEMDTVYDYKEEAQKSLYSSLQYSCYRSKKKAITDVDVEVVIDTELLEKDKDAFVNRYSSEHKLFPFYFSNQIFEEDN